jgi:hypothetical protein
MVQTIGAWYRDPDTNAVFKLLTIRDKTVVVLDAWGNRREFARASWELEMEVV